MAEIRINATGGVKLYDADDSHYAQIIAGTITSNTDVMTLGHAAVVMGTKLDLNGNNLILDADADTYLDGGTADDVVDVYVAGAKDWKFGANSINVLSGTTLTIDSGATITNSGTANGFGSADPASADGDTLGTASLEWSDLFLADGGIIKFGNDQDITLTHNADTGLTLNGVMVATTVEPSADTAAGDNAAIGYTSAEGLILTGQGSTDDITIKNDADTTILNVATGDTDIEISAGNIFFGTANKGVYLGVTSATAANLLDDYEEGTATVGLHDGGDLAINTSMRTLKYTKVGNMVNIHGKIEVGTTGSVADTMAITGLPFTTGSGDDKLSVGSCIASGVAYQNTSATQICCSIANTTTNLYFQVSQHNAASSGVRGSDVSDGDFFTVNATYNL